MLFPKFYSTVKGFLGGFLLHSINSALLPPSLDCPEFVLNFYYQDTAVFLLI